MLSKMSSALASDTRLTIDPVTLRTFLVRCRAVEGRILLGHAVGTNLITVTTPAKRAPIQGAKVNLSASFSTRRTPAGGETSSSQSCVVNSPRPLGVVIFQVRNLRPNLVVLLGLPVLTKVPRFMGLLFLGQVVLVLRNQMEEVPERRDLIVTIKHHLAEVRTARQFLLQGSHFPLKGLPSLSEPSREIHLVSSFMELNHRALDLFKRGVRGERDTLPLSLSCLTGCVISRTTNCKQLCSARPVQFGPRGIVAAFKTLPKQILSKTVNQIRVDDPFSVFFKGSLKVFKPVLPSSDATPLQLDLELLNLAEENILVGNRNLLQTLSQLQLSVNILTGSTLKPTRQPLTNLKLPSLNILSVLN